MLNEFVILLLHSTKRNKNMHGMLILVILNEYTTLDLHPMSGLSL